MMKQNVYIILFVVSVGKVLAQNSNPFSLELQLGMLEYTLLPSLGNVQLEKQGVTFNFGKPLGRSFFGFGLGYTKQDLVFKEMNSTDQFNAFEDLHNTRLQLTYRQPLKNNWSFSAAMSPTLSSNFQNDLSMEDVVFSSFALFNKYWFKDGLRSSLKLGIGYGTLFGEPSLIPMISYSKQLNERLGYSIGLPISGLYYTINSYNTMHFTLKPEGFFANNSGDFFIDGTITERNTKLQFNALNLALGYKLRFDGNWTTFLNLEYLPTSNMKILNANGDEIFDFNSNESVSINVGLTFNINKNNNNENKERKKRL